MQYKLPVMYEDLEFWERKLVREQYIELQDNFCMYCSSPLEGPVPTHIKSKKINWKLFPPNFLKHPIHLQHCHKTGLTEGAVHAYCNAVLWQYEGR